MNDTWFKSSIIHSRIESLKNLNNASVGDEQVYDSPFDVYIVFVMVDG